METTTRNIEQATPVAVERNGYGAIKNIPDWVRSIISDCETAGAFETGIESSRNGKFWTAINTDTYCYDESRGLAIIQIRHSSSNKYGVQVRKNYMLIGRNENGSAFAHPIEARAAGAFVADDPAAGIEKALCAIWGCSARDLGDVIRNGDVAFVPVAKLPEGAVPLNGDTPVILRDSHRVEGNLYRLGDVIYSSGRARIKHTKHQHPTASVRMGYYRVVLGYRAEQWSFSMATAD